MPEIDLTADSIWERQPGEPVEAYDAFAVFRGLGDGASVEAACCRHVGGDPTPEGLAQWHQWAQEWHWEVRAARHRDHAAQAAREARELAQRWSSAKEFYGAGEERAPGFLSRLFGRSRSKEMRRAPTPRPPRSSRAAHERRQGALSRWMKERELRGHLQRQERAASRGAAPKKRQSLAERLHLMRQRRKDTTKKQLKGWRAKLMHRTRRPRMWARRRPGQAFLVLAATLTLLGAFSGALVMRWRRLRMANAVVFTINQTNVRRQEFQTRLEQAAGRTVMQGYLDQTLRRQFAEAKRAVPTEAEVNARVAEDSKQPEFRQTLSTAGMDMDAYRQAVRDELSQVKLMSEGVTVTDAEVFDFYKRNIDKRNPAARFYTPETVQVAVIGTRSRQTAMAALDDLREGVPWDDAARTHSVDVSAFSGGVLPPFGRGRTLAAQIPGMEQAIFGMQPGQRIGPAKFGEGWWIIQCRDKRAERTLPFEQVKHRARAWLLLEKGTAKNGRRIATEYAAFQKKARVQVFDPLYRSMMTPAR